jgi:hypothetical protein
MATSGSPEKMLSGLILSTYRFDEAQYNSLNKGSTEFVKSYFNGELGSTGNMLFSYLDGLDPHLPEYYQFGADKCGVDDFKEFCKELDIDIEENLMRSIKRTEEATKKIVNASFEERSYYSRRIGRYHFYSRTGRLMISLSSSAFLENDIGYFGVTGGKEEVEAAFHVFSRRIECTESSWGGRDYI